MGSEKKLNQLVINKLTMAQYQKTTPSDDELYFVTDEAEGFPSQGSSDKGKALIAVGDGTVEWGSVASLASANEWTGANTFKNNQTIAKTYYLNCDTINSSSTGNSMLRMYYDTDGAYKVLLGTVYRQATILGSTDRPYYAKDGEGFQAHELALKEDVPTDYVTATTAQTISGSKIFTGAMTTGAITPSATNAYSLGTSDLAWNNVYTTNFNIKNKNAETVTLNFQNSYSSAYISLDAYSFVIGGQWPTLYPASNGNQNLGKTGNLWKDLYLSGNLTNGTSNVSITDLINLVAYAKKQGWLS